MMVSLILHPILMMYAHVMSITIMVNEIYIFPSTSYWDDEVHKLEYHWMYVCRLHKRMYKQDIRFKSTFVKNCAETYVLKNCSKCDVVLGFVTLFVSQF